MNLIAGTAVAGRPLIEEAANWQSDSVRERTPVAEVRSAEQAWSFERIYDEYKTPIYNYIYHLVGSREQADDLTQDTFLKAFKALPKMDANLKLSAWLYLETESGDQGALAGLHNWHVGVGRDIVSGVRG